MRTKRIGYEHIRVPGNVSKSYDFVKIIITCWGDGRWPCGADGFFYLTENTYFQSAGWLADWCLSLSWKAARG